LYPFCFTFLARKKQQGLKPEVIQGDLRHD